MECWPYFVVSRQRSLFGALCVPGGLSARGNGADHVRACAVRMDGDVRLFVDRDRQCDGPHLEASVGRPDRQGECAGRRGFHPNLPCHRLALGQTDVGHLVGLGCPADVGFDPFFLYLGYIALNNAFDDPVRGAKASAVLALVGAVNLPIIKFSVDWWNTLHQPASVTRLDAPAIHSSMLWPLLLMALGFTLFYVSILILRVRSEVAAARIRNLQLVEARG